MREALTSWYKKVRKRSSKSPRAPRVFRMKEFLNCIFPQKFVLPPCNVGKQQIDFGSLSNTSTKQKVDENAGTIFKSLSESSFNVSVTENFVSI